MECSENRRTTRTKLVRVLSFSTVAALTLNLAPAPIAASDAHAAASIVSGQKTHFLALGIGKSAVIDLPRDSKDVLVADPKIANAVVHSAQRAYIIGTAVGQTTSCSSMPTASRSPPTTSPSNATSTVCAPL